MQKRLVNISITNMYVLVSYYFWKHIFLGIFENLNFLSKPSRMKKNLTNHEFSHHFSSFLLIFDFSNHYVIKG